MQRKTIFDTLDGPAAVNFDKLARNVRVVAETLARHLYKLRPSEYVFVGDKVGTVRVFGLRLLTFERLVLDMKLFLMGLWTG